MIFLGHFPERIAIKRIYGNVQAALSEICLFDQTVMVRNVDLCVFCNSAGKLYFHILQWTLV